MNFLNDKVTLSSCRDTPHWSVGETFATDFQEPVWSNIDGWYWTATQGWFELIPRNRRQGGGNRGGASGSAW